jgi:predicted branched-subunit amino acid permease
MASPAQTLLALWRHPEFARGAREMTSTALGIGAWGLVTGVAMATSGLPLPLAVLMSLLVFSGGAQLAAVPLFVSGAPLWVIWATALCINLRFVIFSAGWRPYFANLPRAERMRIAYFAADLNYVLFLQRFPNAEPAPGQVPYFWGGAACNWTAWQLPSLAGLLLADHIPPAWGVGFAGTLALLGITLTMLSDRSAWIAAAVASCAAVAAYALPLRLNIVVAIAAAVAAGLLMQRVSHGRRHPTR